MRYDPGRCALGWYAPPVARRSLISWITPFGRLLREPGCYDVGAEVEPLPDSEAGRSAAPLAPEAHRSHRDAEVLGELRDGEDFGEAGLRGNDLHLGRV